MARLFTGDRDEALDVVQEAMLQLVRHYAERSEAEWDALFYRIL
jgi:RNA polymerase sigma-70 factor (ECF subfamily)